MRWRQAAISVGVVLLLLLLSPGRILGQWNPLNPVMFSNLWDATEAFYRLGQHRAGVWNYHGESVDLSQAIPTYRCRCFYRAMGTESSS